MTRDYNPRRYKTRTGDRDQRTPTERQLDKIAAERDTLRAELDALRDTMEVMDRGLTSTTRALDVALDTQHRYRIAFMLFAQNMRPNMGWQELWVAWLAQADKHIGGR